MNLDAILKTIALLGSDLPAYKALFDEVVSMFNEDDQNTLKETYAAAMAASDKQHDEAQKKD